MKFNGPAPELVNGRLAMLGVLWVAPTEASTGETALSQFIHAPWWTYAWLAVWVYATLAPLLKGAKMEPFGIFTPRAEVTNGRAAMLGFVILMVLEWKSGVPFF